VSSLMQGQSDSRTASMSTKASAAAVVATPERYIPAT
jgi:hypothetical protein